MVVNITKRSQGPIKYENLLPKIKKFQESMKMLANKTQNLPISEKFIAKQKAPTVSKPTKVVEIKSDNKKKSPVELEMGYDIIEDIKKTKGNISLFEMYNLPQQKKKILEALDPQPRRTEDNVPLDQEINDASIGENSKS